MLLEIFGISMLVFFGGNILLKIFTGKFGWDYGEWYVLENII